MGITPEEVFLSHASQDEAFATELAAELRRHNVPVWYSATNIVGAQQWHDEIGSALDRCDWFVVILGVAVGAKEVGLLAGVAIGGTVTFEALMGGPVSGASMNPARSLAPALISLDLAAQWVYVIGPVLGALLAVPAYRAVYGDYAPTPLRRTP